MKPVFLFMLLFVAGALFAQTPGSRYGKVLKDPKTKERASKADWWIIQKKLCTDSLASRPSHQQKKSR